MSPSSRSTTAVAVFVFAAASSEVSAHALEGAAAAAPAWAPLSCPPPTSPFPRACTEVNNGTADVAVTLMLQTEAAGPSWLSCVDAADADVTYCARRWSAAQSGGVGSCYFVLPAGRAYACTSGGGVNTIDASSAPLSGRVLARAWAPVACPGPSGGNCSRTNAAATDEWVLASLAAPGAPGVGPATAYACKISAAAIAGAGPAAPAPPSVCSFSAPAGAGNATASSCGFVLPAGATVACSTPAGAAPPEFGATVAAPFAAPYATAGAAPAAAACPPAVFPSPTDCDCAGASAPPGADVVTTVSAVAVDGNFSSFHCYVGSTNVCAFGVAGAQAGLGGGCTFILPAGAALECVMEWGALAFTATAALATGRSLFPPPPQAGAAAAARAATHPAPSTPPPPRYRATLGAAAGGVGAASAADDAEGARLRALFAAWRAGAARAPYATPDEAEARFMRFAGHVAVVEQAVARRLVVGRPGVDAATGRATAGFNSFADWSRAEFEAHFRVGGARATTTRRAPARAAPLPTLPPPPPARAPPPAAVNWTAAGAVTAVKDQGQCGSCWAFSTTGAVEAATALAAAAAPVPLSEQALVSCETDCDGCGGGWPYLAIGWLRAKGAYTEAAYPYASGGGAAPACAPPPAGPTAAVNVTGYYRVGGAHNTSAEVEAALVGAVAAYGPVSVSLDAMTQVWWPYTGGVVVSCCDADVDHAVLVTGYGADAGVDYWSIKNSWGAGWGEAGYIRLGRGTNECDIAYEPVLAAVAGGALPPPPPQPGPYPPWGCPFDAAAVNTSTTAACLWRNGTAGMRMPSAVGAYCEYFADGYMGYSWPASEGTADDFPCAPSMRLSDDDPKYCVLQNGSAWVAFPPHATAVCGQLASDGVFGFEWPI